MGMVVGDKKIVSQRAGRRVLLAVSYSESGLQFSLFLFYSRLHSTGPGALSSDLKRIRNECEGEVRLGVVALPALEVVVISVIGRGPDS